MFCENFEKQRTKRNQDTLPWFPFVPGFSFVSFLLCIACWGFQNKITIHFLLYRAALPHLPALLSDFLMRRSMTWWWKRRVVHGNTWFAFRRIDSVITVMWKWWSLSVREDLKHHPSPNDPSSDYPSRKYLSAVRDRFLWALCTRPRETTQSGGEICLPNVYTKLTPSAYPISEKWEKELVVTRKANIEEICFARCDAGKVEVTCSSRLILAWNLCDLILSL